MAADSYSSVLGWLQMGTGNDNNSWGLNHNSGVSQVFESAIAGALSVVMAGGTYDLSANPPPAGPSSAAYKILNCSGTAATLKVPNLTMDWVVFNNTNNDFLMQTPSGAAICIPKGTHKRVWCDGANTLHRHDENDIGEIKSFALQAVPPGFFECLGSTKSQATYPDLYGKLGTVWGPNTGGLFTLPLLSDTGRYLRSRIPGTNDAGAYMANGVGPHTHTATGNVTDPGHAHTTADPGHTHGTSDPGHAHSYNDPGHSHSVVDPGHVHCIADPGHSHAPAVGSAFYVNTAGLAVSTGGNTGASSTTASSVTGIGIDAASTGIGLLPNGTGITIDSHTTGLSVSSGTTGLSINTHTTGITVGVTVNASTGTETRPETAVVRMCIRY